MKKQYVPILVIGGGQAGLAVGYYLSRLGIPFRILDAHQQVGDAWRNRWDSLRLFTPARYVSLPGLPFPARGDTFPTKEEMATYMQSYARRFRLPISNGARVDRLTREASRFVATCGDMQYEAEQVVVAMSNYQVPSIPEFAAQLDPRIRQLHSSEYRNLAQLREGGVLVVGAGNSGADIAMEVSQSHTTWMSGKESGVVPVRIETFLARFLTIRLVRFIGHHVLSLATPVGRKMRPKMLRTPAPLVRVKPQDLVDAGVERVLRVVGVRGGRPLLQDGRVLDVNNVIWCTGYQHDFPWIDMPIFDALGEPRHEAGIVSEVPGLYFVGLHFLYAMTSATLIGIGRDADRIVRAIEERSREVRVAS